MDKEQFKNLHLGDAVQFRKSKTGEYGEGMVLAILAWSSSPIRIQWVSLNGDKHIEGFNFEDFDWIEYA